MEGAVDVKLLVTLGGIFVSVIAAAAVAKNQIARLTELLRDVEVRMRASDNRTDAVENPLSVQVQRLDVIAKMMSPEVMERRARESATTLARIEMLERTQTKIETRVGLNGNNQPN